MCVFMCSSLCVCMKFVCVFMSVCVCVKERWGWEGGGGDSEGNTEHVGEAVVLICPCWMHLGSFCKWCIWLMSKISMVWCYTAAGFMNYNFITILWQNICACVSCVEVLLQSRFTGADCGILLQCMCTWCIHFCEVTVVICVVNAGVWVSERFKVSWFCCSLFTHYALLCSVTY